MNITATGPGSAYDSATEENALHESNLHDGRPEPLRRPIRGRMLTGVAAGVAEYLGLDVTVVRIILAVLVIAVGAGIPLYLAAWLLIPAEGSDQSIAGEFIGTHRPRSL